MCGQGGDAALVAEVPELDGLVKRSGGQDVASGIVRDAHDIVGVAGEGGSGLLRLDVPDDGGAVVGGRGELGRVVRPRHVGQSSRVSGQIPLKLSVRRTPQLHRLVGRRRRQQTSVATELHARNRALVSVKNKPN